MFERLLRTNPFEVQFWGYELGNVVAAIAAVGTLGVGWSVTKISHALPELIVPIALALLMGFVSIGGRLLASAERSHFIGVLNCLCAIFGCGLLAWALWVGKDWLSAAAVAFLTGSALIRLTERNLIFLKLGAIFLILGGLSLAGYGYQEDIGNAVNALTVLTGLYVAGAGNLTYIGAVKMSETQDCVWTETGLSKILEVQVRLDRALLWTAQYIVEPAIFWVSKDTKANRPFLTSMWSRLPFRVATAVAALATLSPQGYAFALANVLWAIGDIAIGALDWSDQSPDHSATEELRRSPLGI